jgi:D-glycero-alpha-D-manno-heptose-7-phosphate kinase
MISKQETKVVRARAPLRLGLAGGGTDLAPYSDDYGGAVLNITIDRYAYAYIVPRQDGRIVFQAQDLGLIETFERLDDVTSAKLMIHRGVYERIRRDFNGGRHISATFTTGVDAPMGSGLGSSSSLVVALVEAFRHLLNLPLGPYDVAHLAFEIERIDLALSGGKQDQYAAAFGGANFVEFLRNDRVIVNPLRVAEDVLNELEASMVVAFSGQSRSSAAIIDNQKSAMHAQNPGAIAALHQLKADALEMKMFLLKGDISGMGSILARSWLAKKATASGITTSRIDELYTTAMQAGAMAGKVSGAGGGGFLMFLVRPEDRHNVISALTLAGSAAGPVKFTSLGAQSWSRLY